jgi:hypothetical protein
MNWQRTNSEYTKEPTGLTADEKLASLFQPDTLLSAQYFDNLRRRTLLEPEKRLVLAILEDAINCFQDNLFARSAKKKKLLREAEEWIVGDGGDWIFSFENVCEILGFNPQYVRQGLLRWKEKKLSKPPSEVWLETKDGWVSSAEEQTGARRNSGRTRPGSDRSLPVPLPHREKQVEFRRRRAH